MFVLTLKALERRIGLRRDATRAPIQGPECQGAGFYSRPLNSNPRPRWALSDCGQKMVLTMGSTLGIYIKHDDFASPRIPHLWNQTSSGLESEIRRVFQRENLLPDLFCALGIGGEQAWQTVMLRCLHKESTKGGERTSFGEVLEDVDELNVPFVRILKAALTRTEGKTFFPYMADIVGNTICADYLDYLRRDPTNVGLDVLRDDRVASR